MTKPGVPDTVSNLDHNVVTEVLSRHACNVTDASKDLGVSPSDLRRLLWANPKLQDAAFEVVESRLELAEKNIAEALNSDDSRRRDAASFFVIRNSVRAKRRGWITSASASVELNVNSNLPPRTLTFRWRTSEDDERDAEAAEAERLRDGRNHVASIEWGGTNGGKTVEHVASRSLRAKTKILTTA
jgi:hypothetical protein